MQKVISINLNGHAYHLEEGGYEALRAYLDRAAARLKDNPDRDEIIADLEQAIADKSAAYLGPHKTVVTVREVEQILAEMGPVHDPAAAAAGEPAAAGAPTGAPAGDKARTDRDAPKRLYQIQEGAMLSGVCNGLAAYLHVDVTIVRIAFVVLAVLTKGIWVLVYAAMALMIPVAATGEERAAAHGLPFNAQELIDRTRKNYRRQSRHWARKWRRATRPSSGVAPGTDRPIYVTQVMTGVLAPLSAVVQAAAFVLLVLAIISLVNHNVVFGWAVPKEIPLWAGVLMLVLLYQAIVSPLQAARYAMAYAPGGAPYHGRHEAWTGMVSLAATLFGFWLAYEYVPEVREFVHALPAIAREVWETIERR